MRVRREVQRHVVKENGEIRTVVEIEATKKILVGLTAAGVLRDDDAGNGLQNFSRTKNGTVLNFLCAHGSLGSGIGNADKIILPALHVHGRTDGSYCQGDAQRRWCLGTDGDSHFFGLKSRMGNDEPIITSR